MLSFKHCLIVYIFFSLPWQSPTSRQEVDSEKLRHFQAQDEGESDEDLALAISLSLQPLPPTADEKAQPPPNRWARRSRSARDESS